MTLLKLFWSFFQIGLFSIGGGYAALPLIQEHIVRQNGWLTMMEFTDVVTISQLTPGPIAINAATFVGMRIAGLPGSIVATLGNVTPSFIICLTLAVLYRKYHNLSVVESVLASLRPAVVALIAAAGLSILVDSFWRGAGFSPNLASLDWIAVVITLAGVVLMRIRKPDPMLLILGGGVVGLAVYTVLP